MCCGKDNAQPRVATEPWSVKLADGKTVMVTSKAQEREEVDKAFIRERARHRQGGGGYTVTR